MTNESPAITIRPADAADIEPCARIVNDWIDATDWMPRIHDHDDVRRHYREHVFVRHEVLVADHAGIPTGFLGLDGSRISEFCVDGRRRGAGIGSRLLAAAKGLKPDGLDLWTFEANEPAKRFYEARGFSAVERTAGDNEEGLPDVRYHWMGAETATGKERGMNP